MATDRKRSRRLTVTAACSLLILLLIFLVPGCSWFSSSKEKQKENAEESKAITCPLCGLEVADRSPIDRRPVAIKVENDPAARPQSSLSKACLIYEEVTEGGITRFMALFLCRDAETVGPVRSARPADIDLVYPYQALFCHCGGAPPTLSAIKSSGIYDLDELGHADAYWRSRDRRAPHNLYANTGTLRAQGDALCPFEGEVGSPFGFLDSDGVAELERVRAEEAARLAEYQKDPQGEFQPKVSLVNNFGIPYTSVCAVNYSYDPATRKYSRFVRGEPHTDMTTGQQLTVDTIIVQYVVESQSGIKDVRGVDSPELGVVGFGRAQVFMMGQMIDANWDKQTRQDHTRYFDNDGNNIKMKPGLIWIQLVPVDMRLSLG